VDNVLTAQRIKIACKSQNITVARVLENNEIRKSLIYDMEKRNWTPSAEVLFKIADQLECSVDYLLGRTDKPEVNR